MGSTQAVNRVHQGVAAMTSVITDVVQSCASSSDVSQVISVYQDCKNARVDISHVRFSSLATVDLKCTQNASAKQGVSTQIDQDAAQMATAVAGILGINLSSQEAQNIASMSMTVATTVKNSVAQAASAAVNANQGIYIHQSGDSCGVTLKLISFDSIASSVADVVQHSSSIQTAVTALVQEIQQVASAKVRSLVETLAVALVVLVAVVLGGAALFRAAKRTPALPAATPPAAPPLIPGVA